MNEHLALVDRVARIENILMSKNANKTFLGKNNQTTLHKVTSIQDLMRNSRMKTSEKAKYRNRNLP
jgi:hypothetical protein